MEQNNDMQDARFQYVLRLADNPLVLGQRLGEWTGHSPAVELDMAATNLALDLIGQAQHFLGYAGEVEGKGRSADDLAFLRDANAFRNFLLIEQPNRDWAHTTTRQYLFSSWQTLALEALSGSSDETLAAIGQKALIEARYHESFARDWMLRLGDGTEESHARMMDALDSLWHFTGEMFEMDGPGGIDEMMLAEGVGFDAGALEAPWRAKVDATLAEATLAAPEVGRMAHLSSGGGRDGSHSEYLGHILSEMQFLQRAYPGLEW